jgi:type VI secretion system protein VasJ
VPDAPTAPTEVQNRAELARYLGSLHTSLADMGKALRKLNPADPLAYMLPRVGAALELDELPPSNGGRTFVAAPDRGEVEEIRGLLREQSWLPLLAAAEACAAQNPLFLDMQRLVHTALTSLGEAYAPCRLVVEAELCALMRRLPGLSELSFSNGVAFADADTRTFLTATIVAGPGGAAAGGGSADDPAQGEALAAARALAVSGKKLESLSAFEQVLRQAKSGRARFQARLGLASAMLAAGDALLAAGLFGALYEEIDRLGLDEWEPALAADCLADYHDCLTRSGPSPEMAQRRSVVYARLCRVDPRRALKSST